MIIRVYLVTLIDPVRILVRRLSVLNSLTVADKKGIKVCS